MVSVEKVSEAFLAELSALGLGIELSHFSNPAHLDADTLAEDIKRHHRLLRSFEGEKSMHGAFYDLNLTARDERIVSVCRFRIQESIDIATELELDKIVFHTNFVPSSRSGYLAYWQQKQIRFWSEFVPVLEARGITAFLENTREEDAGHIAEIVSGLGSERIKVCYDTGHSHCFTESKIPPVEWVRGYGAQLGYVHLHANHGLTDDHIAFTEGNIDFSGFFEALSACSPMPLLIIEVKSREAYERSVAALQAMRWI